MVRLVRALAVLTALALVGILGATSVAANDKVTICHAAGQAGTTHYITLTVSRNAVYKDQGGHFYENGTPQAGHEQDYFGTCEEPEVASPTVATDIDCGTVTLDFDNPTDWLFAFEYRVDDEASVSQSPYYPSDPDQYHVVNVAAGANVQTVLTFDEDSGTHTVAVRLRLGAESDYFFDWIIFEVDSDCAPNETPTPTPTPSEPELTPTPTPTPVASETPVATPTPAAVVTIQRTSLPNTAMNVDQGEKNAMIPLLIAFLVGAIVFWAWMKVGSARKG